VFTYRLGYVYQFSAISVPYFFHID
jgi:hypothetical protein